MRVAYLGDTRQHKTGPVKAMRLIASGRKDKACPGFEKKYTVQRIELFHDPTLNNE